jgi:hypothetical protein
MKMPKPVELDLWRQGYRVLFRRGETNRCPGCGHSQWLVGRTTAECAVCATALPLAEADLGGFSPSLQRAVALRLVQASEPSEKRVHERLPGDGRVLSLHVDGCVHPFVLQNISAGGLRAELGFDLDGATSVVVELEDGTLLPAEIRWTDGSAAGLAFLRS